MVLQFVTVRQRYRYKSQERTCVGNCLHQYSVFVLCYEIKLASNIKKIANTNKVFRKTANEVLSSRNIKPLELAFR